MENTDNTADPRETRTFPTGELVYKKEAAKFLGVSLKTVDRYVADGRLQNWKNQVNGRTYYDKQDLLKLLGSRPLSHAQGVPTVRTWGLRSTASPGPGPYPLLPRPRGSQESGSIGTPRDTGRQDFPMGPRPGYK
jgi:hypothetical protein